MLKKELNTIKITVSGPSAVGKSRLIFLLKNFLREQDFNVELYPIEYDTEDDFDSHMIKGFDDVIQNIKETRKILIKEHHSYETMVN